MNNPRFILAMVVATVLCAAGLCIYIYDPGPIAGGRWMDVQSPARYALDSLEVLSIESPDVFDRVMSHPEVEDGITGEEPLVLALIADIGINNPSLVDALLDPSIRQIEKRDVTLPLRGDVQLVIVRLEPGAARTMDFLESAVRFAERYMGERFPTKLVLLLVADAVNEDYAGHYTHINMAIDPDLDAESRLAAHQAPSVLTHEVAHHYWANSAEIWLDEGAAEIMAVIHEESRSGYRASHSDSTLPCSLPNLQSLELLSGEPSDDCVYSLGPRLFLDLYRTLGPDDFQRGFRGLYLAGRDALWTEDPSARSIEQLTDAFSFSAEAMDEVIPKWYGERP